MPDSPSQEPQDDTTDPSGEPPVSPAADQADGSTAETPPEKRPRRPLVFGRGGFFATVIPYVVFLGGLSLGSYLESARDAAHIKQKKLPVLNAIAELDTYFENLQIAGKKPEADAWREYLNWDDFVEAVKDPDHAETPETNREAAKRLYGDRAGLDGPKFVKLRAEFEKYIRYWQAYEAAAKGEEPPAAANLNGNAEEAEIRYVRWYPTYYTYVITATALMMLIAMPWYFKTPLNFSWLAIVVGVVGIVAWIGLYLLDKNLLHLGEWYPASRAAFNPFNELKHDPKWMWQFIYIRFAGLVLVVPIVEEFFLRGWLMRYIDDPDWDEIPLGEAGKWALIGVPIYGALTHPNEPLAAIVWFSMVTWLYLRTKSIWNCVIAHAITNLLLGIYVIQTGTWELW
jgi:CAAX prenyl protease-like protein